MSLVALTNFLTITLPDGNDPDAEFLSPNRFQNGNFTEPLTHPVENKTHQYLSFIYQGATLNRSGDNLESTLILANNAISMGYAKAAVDNKFHARVDTYLMKEDFTPNKLLTSEVWLVSSLGYDPTTIELLLSSAIDAVGANAPNRILTQNLVGHLPVTAQIQTR